MPTDRFLAAAVTGILHGKSASYLSELMPNTFSMAPRYVRDFARRTAFESPGVTSSMASRPSSIDSSDSRRHRPGRSPCSGTLATSRRAPRRAPRPGTARIARDWS